MLSFHVKLGLYPSWLLARHPDLGTTGLGSRVHHAEALEGEKVSLDP